eukprot:TRINITY_DN15784_c0_g1_i1.p1 TRINITY_DN15784_c0_g1~~TRINITY_DN15784_c0_g1_i1.p1  ORF type:complete len:460 (+),score=149.04 TRINITY_DN15784_c0_g1_i1:662-2041(+)
MPYSFPILERKDIITNLAELEIAITEQDLMKPTAETMKPVFEQIVQSVSGVTREELTQPVFAAMDILDNPELHEESIGNLAFTRAISKLMFASGVTDFSMKDVFKPEYNRVVRHLSAIINFAKFREEKNIAFEDYQAKSEELMERRQQAEETNLQLAGQLRQIQLERDAQEPGVHALELETQELSNQVAALNKAQAGLQTEVRALKQTNNEMAEKVAAERALLLDEQQEVERLKGKIVESPEKLQRQLEELNEVLERERTLIGDLERRARELQSKVDGTAKAEREVHKCLTMMQEAETELQKYKVVSRGLKEAKAQVAANEQAIALLTAEGEHMRRQIQNAEERAQRLHQQVAARQLEAELALEQAKQRKRDAKEQHEAALAKVADKQKQMRLVLLQMDEQRAAHARKVNAAVAQFHNLYRQVSKYHASLFAVMEDPAPLPPRKSLLSAHGPLTTAGGA